MDTITHVRDALAAMTWGEWREVESATHVPVYTIRRIAKGLTRNPGFRTVETLYVHLLERPAA